MGFELLILSAGRRAASQGHVCAVAKRVTALPPDRMSGTSDTAKKKWTLHFHFRFPRCTSLSPSASFNLLLSSSSSSITSLLSVFACALSSFFPPFSVVLLGCFFFNAGRQVFTDPHQRLSASASPAADSRGYRFFCLSPCRTDFQHTKQSADR